MINTQQFCEYLTGKGIDFFAGVPDSLLQSLCERLSEGIVGCRHITTANEGNALALACGYHIATGKIPAVYMQNSGLGNIVNPLLSLSDEKVYKIPSLLIIGWRGEPGTKDEPQHVTQGELTLGLLDVLGVPYYILNDDYEKQVDACLRSMKATGTPAALVVRKGTFEGYSVKKASDRFTLKREEALETIIDLIGDQSFIVSTTGKTSREIFEIRERRQEGHDHDFLTVGSMGHTASIAFGMSIGTKENVYCIDGDGSFLMHLGSIGVVAQHVGDNFKYILMNNGAHESVGGQATIGFDIDIQKLLESMGFKTVKIVSTIPEIEREIGAFQTNSLQALVININQGSRANLGRPTITPEQNKRDMMCIFKNEGGGIG